MSKYIKHGKVGKPTKLTPQLKKDVIELIRRYYFYHIVCAKVDISYGSLETYRKKDKIFADDIAQARVLHLSDTLDSANRTGHKDWRFHFHKLAVSDPEHFSEKRKLELSGEDGKPVAIQIVKNYGGKK